jgi:4-hydroxy-tetrahydrodipicolinate synthase
VNELGVLVPIVTPCSRSGEIDLNGLRSVCQHMLGAGCRAFFVAGSTGRGPWFSGTDRVKLCRDLAESVGSEAALFAGCMATGMEPMLENARAMADAGAQFAVLTAPGYFNYSNDEVETIFLGFADRSPLPVIIYDIPDFAGMKLDTRLLERLAHHGNIRGFKDSSADLERFLQLASAVADIDQFYLLQGKEHILAESLANGASGFVVSLVHVAPELFVALYTMVRSGRLEDSKRIQDTITELMEILVGSFQRRPYTSTLFHFLNQVLRAKGLCDNIVLDFEGDCPPWLSEEAKRALQLCADAWPTPAGEMA